MTGDGSPSEIRVEFTKTISSDRDAVEGVLAACMSGLQECGYDETGTFAIRLAMEEALANAMNHGNAGDAHKSIKVQFQMEPCSFRASIEDEGPGYDQASVPDPTADENLTIASGRGLVLMRAFMTEVVVVPPGNRIEMAYQPQCSAE